MRLIYKFNRIHESIFALTTLTIETVEHFFNKFFSIPE